MHGEGIEGYRKLDVSEVRGVLEGHHGRCEQESLVGIFWAGSKPQVLEERHISFYESQVSRRKDELHIQPPRRMANHCVNKHGGGYFRVIFTFQ